MSADLFLRKVAMDPSPTGCWEWRGAQGSDGYGRVRRKSKTYSAHRFSYELFKGQIPQGLCVLHQCDNPLCVNPTHLFLGTKRDNTADMLRKGRQGFSGRRLDEEQVLQIRVCLERGENKRTIAERFDVCRSTVQDIASGAHCDVRRQLLLF